MEKVTPGDRTIPGATFNELVDTAGQFRRMFGTGRPETPESYLCRSGEATPIKIKIASSGSRGVGEVLKLDVLSTTTPNKYNTILDGVTPTGPGVSCAILQGSESSGGIVDACVAGACWAYVSVISTSHTRADTINASYMLQSGTTGQFKILYRPNATGTQLCFVLFDSAPGTQAGAWWSVDPVTLTSGATTTITQSSAFVSPGTKAIPHPTSAADLGVGWTYDATNKYLICKTPGFWRIAWNFHFKGDPATDGINATPDIQEHPECYVYLKRGSTGITPSTIPWTAATGISSGGMGATIEGTAHPSGERWQEFALDETLTVQALYSTPAGSAPGGEMTGEMSLLLL